MQTGGDFIPVGGIKRDPLSELLETLSLSKDQAAWSALEVEGGFIVRRGYHYPDAQIRIQKLIYFPEPEPEPCAEERAFVVTGYRDFGPLCFVEIEGRLTYNAEATRLATEEIARRQLRFLRDGG